MESRMLMLIVGCLVLFAVGIMFHVLLVSKDKRFSIRGLFSLLFSTVWLIPVAGVIVILLARTAPQFMERPGDSNKTASGVAGAGPKGSPGPAITGASQSLQPRPPTSNHGFVRGSKPSVNREQNVKSVRAPESPTVVKIDSASNQEVVSVSEEAVTEADPDLPEWVGQPELVSTNGVLVSLSSGRWSTIEEAERVVLDEARKRVMEDFYTQHAYQSGWTVSDDLLNRYALGTPYVEKITVNTETQTFPMYRVHRRLTLSSSLHDKLYPVWREHLVNNRLWILGGLVGFITLVLGTTSTYLRLDSATSGNYRFRLKFAAVSLIVAAGLGVAIAIPGV